MGSPWVELIGLPIGSRWATNETLMATTRTLWAAHWLLWGYPRVTYGLYSRAARVPYSSVLFWTLPVHDGVYHTIPMGPSSKLNGSTPMRRVPTPNDICLRKALGE